ncbi:hypothetical protein SEA_LUCHADOR_90 [Mycobacterium phage Luchador]|uniref:Gp84-like domain-containing protein n=1 Tax=Mycobacterium phage Luchador TaxID=1647300 RepID=A0A0F6WDN9_9CAUD|nr:hypothetical protein AVT52_gp14 [Mycobacterium phage Luchador]AKF14254.1 hypothetical protein SEA_LUCHADOR_90 [Mycobacterium phage Luchador]
MYKITVFKVGSSKTGEGSASSPQILLDHLKESSKRNGFEVRRHAHTGLPSGDLFRDGKLVALWGIEDIEAEVPA